MTARSAVVCFCAALLLGCGRQPDAGRAPAAAVKPGLYRATLKLSGGELPFGLELEPGAKGMVGHLINGGERILLPEVTVSGAHLDIRMPGFENRLSADAGVGGLDGDIVLDKLGGKQQHIPLHAEFGRDYRFFEKPATDNADVSGRWAVKFMDDDGSSENAVGEFSQSHDTVNGTFLTTTGDHRYLAGQMRGDELYLSTFDGAHAYLYRARVTTDGSLAGDYWYGLSGHERWTARRDADAALPDAYSLTTLRAGTKRFEFSFPDLSGRTVNASDPRFRGKVLLVTLAGSWCPNCHDEAAFLAPLYREYRGKGLEIVALMFEHVDDPARAAAATLRFRELYGIEYTTLIAGISDKDEAGKKVPMLSRVVGFPTTLFIDRAGLVRKIHTGFSGPATGAHYAALTQEFKDELDRLLAET
jgi:thiol-disulfide isomerase/thioredoxin